MPHAQISERASLAYRADIDGLRALAVVPVVLYHFRVPPFGGGYVGVDVFFVISGFLITALIHREMQSGEYSLIAFYERRARRILPGLFAMLLAATAGAMWWLFPEELLRFGESMAATALFVSNFDFWQQAGYFDAAAETKPLLHTWSLAVEEQFYLIFPLLLTLLQGHGRRALLLLTGGLGLASFAFGVWAIRTHPTMAFYLAPSRIWELMLGAMLALGEFPRAPRWFSEVLSLLGLALLGIAVFAFSPDTRMPGESALVPCLGAALLLHANGDGKTMVARMLSWRPVVFAGLISYSLYLWHWPVYVFARSLTLTPLGAGATAMLIALSFGFAVLSWRFVEQLFRDRQRFSQRSIFVLAGGGMMLMLLAGGALFASAGLPQRVPPNVQRILAAIHEEDSRRRICGATSAEIADGRECIIGDKRAAPSFALWGDSHALSLLPVVSDVAARRGRAGYYLGHSGCAPLLGAAVMLGEEGRHCARINRAVFVFIAARHIKTVIIAGRWALYDLGRGAGIDARSRRPLIAARWLTGKQGDQHKMFAQDLERVVAKLAAGGIHVILIADVPEIDFDVPTALARLTIGGPQVDIRPTYGSYRARQEGVTKILNDLKARYGVTVVDPSPVFCSSGRCAVADKGVPLYRDNHHLTAFGAAHLAALFSPILQPPAREQAEPLPH